jgi:hypothetical protein
MTFRSDDEYWAWVERQERMRERLDRAARRIAIASACALLLFTVLYFCVRSMGAGHYDPWRQAIHSAAEATPP